MKTKVVLHDWGVSGDERRVGEIRSYTTHSVAVGIGNSLHGVIKTNESWISRLVPPVEPSWKDVVVDFVHTLTKLRPTRFGYVIIVTVVGLLLLGLATIFLYDTKDTAYRPGQQQEMENRR